MHRKHALTQLAPILISLSLALPLAAQAFPPGKELDFTKALQLVIENDPELQRLEALSERTAGNLETATARPNPVVGIEVENILGSGPYSELGSAEVTIGISQLLETGGKREKRAALVREEGSLLQLDREIRLREIEESVRAAFVDVLLADKVLRLHQDKLALAESNKEATARLVEAARASTLESTRAELGVKQAALAAHKAEREARMARTRLALLWGETGAKDLRVAGELQLEAVPDWQTLLEGISTNPSLARFTAEEDYYKAALELETVNARPDIEVFGGARYHNETGGDAGLVLGVEFPWPVFNRNQGRIRSTRAGMRALAHEREAARREFLTGLSTAHEELASAYAEAGSIRLDLLPVAEQMLKEAESGYRQGQFSQLVLLEAQEVLIGIREDELAALQRYARARAWIRSMVNPGASTH